MFTKLLLSSLFVVSTMSYADSVSTTTTQPLTAVLDYSNQVSQNYKYEVINKNKTMSVSIDTVVGQPINFESSTKDGEKCILKIKHSMGNSELDLAELPEKEIKVTILPVQDKNGIIETLIDVNQTQQVNKEDSHLITENCLVSNTLSSTTNVRWLGDLSLDKQKVIKLENGDELYITVSQSLKQK